MADFEVLKEFRSKPVMKLRDTQTGGEFFIKLAGASEVYTTLKASSILPENSIITIPKAHELHPDDVPEAIRKTLESKVHITGDKHTYRFLVTQPVPCDMALGSLDMNKKDAIKALGGKPISRKEWDEMIVDMRKLNMHGVENWDIQSNMFVKRDREGKLGFSLIDFGNEGLSRNNPDAPHEDIAQLRKLEESFEQLGLMEKGHAKPGRTEITLSMPTNAITTRVERYLTEIKKPPTLKL